MGNLQSAEHQSEQTRKEPVSITTWNGAASYATIDDPLVELFYRSVRDMKHTDYRAVSVKKSKKEESHKSKGKSSESDESSKDSIEQYFDKAWVSDPLRTLKFVFYLRDCRGGKGERGLFRALIRHMREQKLHEHVLVNMKHIPSFGSWKDISMCFFGTEFEAEAVELITNQLRQDIKSDQPSLCAKYAPSENGAMDREHKAANKIAADLGVSLTKYRKQYLTPLRNKLNIVEKGMCTKDWDNIDYSKVPSVAGLRYKKAFDRHDEQRYSEYLRAVVRGEKKMNTSVLMPYQIVAPYSNQYGSGALLDETSEAQWKSFVDNKRSKWPKGMDVLPLVDVSGSMFTGESPALVDVAISLGLLFASLNSSEQYKGKFITFDSDPKLLSIPSGSLHSQVKYICDQGYGLNTNLQKAFDLILNAATMFKLSSDQMPKVLLILSDMQFDRADTSTNWEVIEKKYTAAGYKRPIIIFWNLSGKAVDYPVPNKKVPNCALLSGFSDSIMYSLLDGVMPDPATIVRKALDNERYNVIRLSQN